MITSIINNDFYFVSFLALAVVCFLGSVYYYRLKLFTLKSLRFKSNIKIIRSERLAGTVSYIKSSNGRNPLQRKTTGEIELLSKIDALTKNR